MSQICLLLFVALSAAYPYPQVRDDKTLFKY